ncbi:MAG: L-ribulose-5-phosphate 3-epimerase [Oscillospiraceae bacterium]
MLGNHLLGIYEKAFPSSDPLSTVLSKAKKLGFDFVEISIDESDGRLERLEWSREQIEELRRACFSAQIGFQSMCLSAHRRFPFGSADPAVRERARDILRKAIDFASQMGIRVIQLAGYDTYYEPSTPESVRLFREGMAWAARQAEQKQVMLAMEIMDTSFMNSISRHMAYEAMLRSPWYRVYPDLGNLSAWPENDVEFEIENGVKSIVAVHLKDTLAVTDTFPGKFKCVPFGTGCVDFPARFRQLERLGYAGPYMIEMWYAPGTDDLAEIRSAKDWIQKQYDAGVL